MTGREAALYILANGYDDKPLVICIDGKAVQVWDVCYDICNRELIILPDCRGEKGESDYGGRIEAENAQGA